jgi:hypothetical protein
MNTCYLNSLIQGMAASAPSRDLVEGELELNSGLLSSSLYSVLHSLRSHTAPSDQHLKTVVTLFRQTLSGEEKFKPQDVLFAFNSFLELVEKSTANSSLASLFRLRTTTSYTCTCGASVERQPVSSFSLLTNRGIQDELNEMEQGRFDARPPELDEDKCPACKNLTARTHFITFELLPKCLVVFRNSDQLIRSVEDHIVISGVWYVLSAVVFNVEAYHYYCLVVDGKQWFTASDTSVSPVSDGNLSSFTSSLHIHTLPYAFFYSKVEATEAQMEVHLLPFYSTNYSNEELSKLRIIVRDDVLSVIQVAPESSLVSPPFLHQRNNSPAIPNPLKEARKNASSLKNSAPFPAYLPKEGKVGKTKSNSRTVGAPVKPTGYTLDSFFKPKQGSDSADTSSFPFLSPPHPLPNMTPSPFTPSPDLQQHDSLSSTSSSLSSVSRQQPPSADMQLLLCSSKQSSNTTSDNTQSNNIQARNTHSGNTHSSNNQRPQSSIMQSLNTHSGNTQQLQSVNTQSRNTQTNNTQSSNMQQLQHNSTQSSNTQSSNTQSSNTQSRNTQSRHTQSSSRQLHNTHSINTQSANTQSCNTHYRDTQSRNTQ